ncbi:hypothetical protein [uncultured Kordia sp.]|uniref:hypothetical protein n=1 Tax=uncultured Kordia sp. TaxID=507699 RepID=UPI00260C7C17|nr:hypothetical protein [uncultured Kordia sp.]
MKKKKLHKLELHKKSISKLQSQLVKGQFNNQEEDDKFQSWACTFNFACWSIVCPTDLCSANC